MTVHNHTDAVQFHSAIVGQFHQLYHYSTDFKERFNVWTRLLNQYIPPGSFVLDAGCGSGVFSFSLAAQGHRVLGVDGSAAMIQHCQKIREETGSMSASFQQSYLPLQAPLANQAFDAVMASSVLEYVPALDSAILSLSSQLVSGGYFFFSLPNRMSLYRKLERIVFWLTGRPAYLRYVRHYGSVSTLTPSLEKAGLQMVDLQHYGGNTAGFQILKSAFPHAWICPLFVVVCRKN